MTDFTSFRSQTSLFPGGGEAAGWSGQGRGRIGAWLALFLTLAVALPAEEVRRMRVGLEFNSPPLAFVSKGRQLEGFTVELLQEMERVGGITVEYVPGSWLLLTEAFTAGKIDVLANVIITPERRATMDFSIGHASLHASAYTRWGTPSITRTADLAGKKIAILAGSVAARNAVLNRGWGGETVVFSNFRVMLGAVNSGECDVALVLRPFSFEQPDELGLRRELFEDIVHRFHLAVRRDNRELLEPLNEALATVRANGAFDRLYAKWIGPIEPRPIGLRDLRPYFLPASAGALLLGLVFAWQRRVNGVLARQAAALHASEEKYRVVVQNAHEAIFVVQDDALRFVNATAQRMLGIAQTDGTEHSLLDLLPPEARAEIRLSEQRLLAGEAHSTDQRYRVDLPGRGERWIKVTGTPIDWHGRPAILNFATDVTEAERAERQRAQADDRLRESLREKEALLKEVHHRVKNNLQVVTSLLRLEAGRSGPGGTRTVLQEMTGRIRTMALLHETLYRSGDFGRLDLAAYLRQIATQAFRLADRRAGAIQLHLELSPISVDLNHAIPCGLIVNELLTNSLKHGFPETRSGAVRLELATVGEGEMLRLRVSDDGVGLPADFASRRQSSLGLALVSDLARQIDGELAIGPGAAFTVVFSRSRLVSKTTDSPVVPSHHGSSTHSHC